MDWNPKADDGEPSPANSEASGDSETDSAETAALPPAYDNDDAESSSAGDGDGDEEAAGVGGDHDHRQAAAAEKRPCIMSWRGWLQACASEYAAETDRYQRQQQEEEGAASGSGEAADAESNRLFWETCLAQGYP